MKYYLSGPMTGLPDLNYPAFMAAAQFLRSSGHEVYNPAEWEQHNGGVFNLNIAFADYCTYIARTADAVVVLPGWEDSPGARAEVALAMALKKPVLAYGGLPMRDVAADQPPECPLHCATQHRDRKAPWCNRCGWNADRTEKLGERTVGGGWGTRGKS